MPPTARPMLRRLSVLSLEGHRVPGDVLLAEFRGPGHVLVRVNEAYREVFGEPIGVPAREAFPDFSEVHALMDRVFASGRPGKIILPGRVVVVAPVVDQGQIRGVVAHGQLVPAQPMPRWSEVLRRYPRPASRLAA
jgi:hypothetical protein